MVDGAFHTWGVPNSWMVYGGKSENRERDWGVCLPAVSQFLLHFSGHILAPDLSMWIQCHCHRCLQWAPPTKPRAFFVRAACKTHGNQGDFLGWFGRDFPGVLQWIKQFRRGKSRLLYQLQFCIFHHFSATGVPAANSASCHLCFSVRMLRECGDEDIGGNGTDDFETMDSDEDWVGLRRDSSRLRWQLCWVRNLLWQQN